MRKTLNTTLDEGRAMTSDSVRYLKAAGRRVFFDVEHCFDGYKEDPDFTLSVIEAAALAGADCVVLCDTKGGSLPHECRRSPPRSPIASMGCSWESTPRTTPVAPWLTRSPPF